MWRQSFCCLPEGRRRANRGLRHRPSAGQVLRAWCGVERGHVFTKCSWLVFGWAAFPTPAWGLLSASQPRFPDSVSPGCPPLLPRCRPRIPHVCGKPQRSPSMRHSLAVLTVASALRIPHGTISTVRPGPSAAGSRILHTSLWPRSHTGSAI
ncbi:hypothetical protein B0J12DRAFT_128579 [Macrophomina phaseolina]|uniref:Uncharacterized protein n=1 Tax=Macrophomina phaseolina TaxID=35725 RepID=A0ABQ8G858_9PEZI|nr:hypothetical protein B0J12DRAFT_128579 [Macrophomina phaseolina]